MEKRQNGCLSRAYKQLRKEVKNNGQKRRYINLNAETQRKERRGKKLSNAKKEENNRMGKTRNLFKKIRDTKGIFYAKMGTIRDRNHID